MEFDASKCPLTWPERWPRTAPEKRRHSIFGKHSMERVFGALRNQVVSGLGSNSWVFSSNVPRRAKDGLPFSNQPLLKDPGVAVYFELKGRAVSLACDKWLRVECNTWSIAKHIEALRGQERWGVGSVEQAFRGYMALPGIGETNGSSWWQTLGVAINASPEQVKEAYRLLAKKHHPDRGGDAELFNRIQSAYEAFGKQ